jgi:cell wall-associated NlpC family hydrolase
VSSLNTQFRGTVGRISPGRVRWEVAVRAVSKTCVLGRVGQGLASIAASIVLVVALGAGTAVAVPPPPPNPSDQELGSTRADANTKAAEVGALTNQVAEAEAQLANLEADVALKMEEANKALVDLESAQEVAAQAKADAESARLEADGAGQAIEQARTDLDAFAAGSYRQGTAIGSISAYLSAKSPSDLLERAHLLNAVGGSQLDVLEGMEVARTAKANADSAARAALDLANQKEAQAQEAKSAADSATALAQQAQEAQAAQTETIQSQKASAEAALAAAQSTVAGLEGQRASYEQWQAAKAAEEAAAAAAAQQPSPGGGGGGGGDVAPAPSGGSVAEVIARAKSQLGLPYTWGGGNHKGPTRGIPDGGVGQANGDHYKTGFDCSGLMIYAFAGAGFRLPHYSGYQYKAGPRVPLSQKAPGDMLFWAKRGRIHHVALYIGGGKMIEAPRSGLRVRITSVRYGGIVPYATRLL